MVDVAILVSVGRHPASGRARRAPSDARALELAFGLPPGRRDALHAGDPANPALHDYLGMGLERLTVLAMAEGRDPTDALAARLRGMSPGIILTGNRAEGGEDSGALPYAVAQALGLAIVPDVVAIALDADGLTAEVVQALARGQRRALRVELPFAATVHPSAPAARPSAFGPARRGRIEVLPVDAPPDAFLTACAARPWRARPKRLSVGAAGGGSGGALDRLRAATEAKAGQGRVLVGPSPDEAARAIWDYLQEQGMQPR